MMQQQPNLTILNVDTYRYEGSFDQLFTDQVEIWQHKRSFWERDFESASIDCTIIQNEIVDPSNIRIFIEMMEMIEMKIEEEQKSHPNDPKFLHLLTEFEETQLFNQLFKTLKWFDDALRSKNMFEKLKNWNMNENTLIQLQMMCQWMKGKRFIKMHESSIFVRLLDKMECEEGERCFEKEINSQLKKHIMRQRQRHLL